jgi:DNA adenine methylase
MIEVFTKPPLTYYGGKQMMLKHILPIIPEHRVYNEPFFGGGAVFFAKNPAKVEFINDVNGEIVNFYRVIKRDFDKLKDEIDCTLHSEFQHKQAIEIYRNSADKDAVIRAWAVWMLSHQSFYAIFCNSWKCSKQRNMAKQIQTKKEQFNDVYVKRLEATSIFSRDAIDVIKKTDTQETFHYVDPPYFNSDMGHYGGYSKGNFKDLLNTLSEVKGKFLLSSYPSDILNEYVKRNNWKVIELDLPRAAGGGRKTEVLTLNYDIASLAYH